MSKLNPYQVNVSILICENSEKSFQPMLSDWYSVLLYEASLNIPCNFAATSHDSCTSSTNVKMILAKVTNYEYFRG